MPEAVLDALIVALRHLEVEQRLKHKYLGAATSVDDQAVKAGHHKGVKAE